MTKKIFVLFGMISLFMPFAAIGSQQNGKHFDRAIFVLFENTNYADAAKQPFFKQLSNSGAHFSNFSAITHPSQGNYIALTAGTLGGVRDNSTYDLNIANIADLLESHGLTWKVYAEGFPGDCFTGQVKRRYARKHNPFISYVSIQKDPVRCANIVEASQFDTDAANGKLPNYVFYIPDVFNDGHDTGVEFADTWYRKKLTPYLSDRSFMKRTVIISTFDESGGGGQNQIYTSIVGPDVKPGGVTAALNLYSLLNLIEENWSLGSLGMEDASSVRIPNIWK